MSSGSVSRSFLSSFSFFFDFFRRFESRVLGDLSSRKRASWKSSELKLDSWTCSTELRAPSVEDFGNLKLHFNLGFYILHYSCRSIGACILPEHFPFSFRLIGALGLSIILPSPGASVRRGHVWLGGGWSGGAHQRGSKWLWRQGVSVVEATARNAQWAGAQRSRYAQTGGAWLSAWEVLDQTYSYKKHTKRGFKLPYTYLYAALLPALDV